MTDAATLGNLKTPAPYCPENPISGMLWTKIANKKQGLGNPQPFFGNPEETNWESFTVTLNGNKLLKKIEKFSRNVPGSGALMTFKDSSWRLSIVVAAQPHFINQPEDQTIFWGYGLYTDRIGDYVKKPMRDCTGEEIFTELMHHLHFDDELEEIKKDIVNVIPCMLPYTDAQFQPRAMSDRPKVVPEGSTNLALISQFVEIPEDMVFTEEYSIRAARIAVYTLMGVNRPVCPVTPHASNVNTLLKALVTSYR
jgi:oleate hydratase